MSANEPLPNRADLIHAVRNLNDKNWESPKSAVFKEFYPLYSQFNDGDTTDFNKWYYASFVLLDEEAKKINTGFEEQVAKRNSLLERWIWLAPAAWVHNELSKISLTDRKSHLDFLNRVYANHADLREFYYSKIFKGEQFSEKDLYHLKENL